MAKLIQYCKVKKKKKKKKKSEKKQKKNNKKKLRIKSQKEMDET